MRHNKAFDPASQIKIVKNVMVGHVGGFFQGPEHPFPFNPPIIMEGIPNDLMCFLNAPLKIVLKNESFCCCQTIHKRPLPKKNHIRLNRLTVSHKGRSNKLENDFCGLRFSFLPNDVGIVSSPVLSEGTTVVLVLHRFH